MDQQRLKELYSGIAENAPLLQDGAVSLTEGGTSAKTAEDARKKLGAAAETHTHTAAEVGAAPESHTHANATTTVSGFESAADKAKLDGIAADANKYEHPGNHPASMITGLDPAATTGNASLLQGYDICVGSGKNSHEPYGKIMAVGKDGVVELGRTLDFHNVNEDKDYSYRVMADFTNQRLTGKITEAVTADSAKNADKLGNLPPASYAQYSVEKDSSKLHCRTEFYGEKNLQIFYKATSNFDFIMKELAFSALWIVTNPYAMEECLVAIIHRYGSNMRVKTIFSSGGLTGYCNDLGTLGISNSTRPDDLRSKIILMQDIWA